MTEKKTIHSRARSSGAPQAEAVISRATWATAIIGFLMLGMGVFLLITALPLKHWQNVVGVAIPWLVSATAILGFIMVRRGRVLAGLSLTLGMFLAACVIEVLLISGGYGPILAISAFVITSGMAIFAMPVNRAGRFVIISALVGTAVLLLDIFPPSFLPRQPGKSLSLWAVLIACVAAVVVFLGLILWRFKTFNLRPKLIIFFIVTILLAITAMAVMNGFLIRNALTEAANRALNTGASETAAVVDDFLRRTSYSTNDEAALAGFSAYLSLSPEARHNSAAEQTALSLLQNLKSKAPAYAASYMLIDLNGRVIAETWNVDPDTYPPFLGLDIVDNDSFPLMLNSGYPYVSPLLYSHDDNTYYLYFAGRITGSEHLPVGILVVRYYGDVLQSLVAGKYGLAGENSYPILYDDEGICLAHGLDENLIGTTVVPLDPAKAEAFQTAGQLPPDPIEELTGNYPDLAAGLALGKTGKPFFSALVPGKNAEIHSGAVYYMGTRSWRVAYVQPQSAYLGPVQEQTQWTILLALGIAYLTTISATIMAQFLTRPIMVLTEVAKRVSGGDLMAQAQIRSQDEIGTLAGTFNAMTTELRQTLEGLEHRVAERTSDLSKASEQMQKRANQLEAVSEAARAIASIQNPEELLQTVTRIVSERFGFYHVGIFMLDKVQDYAVLQAANSEGGHRMLARGHRLKKGQGIVGYAVAHGEPRIALDVGTDAVFFDNPDLPYTRSEMALPLKVGERVIGALDVQSIQQSAFIEEDVSVLTTLADQVSIAIENSRLFAETRMALSELQTVHAQYLQEAWSQVAEARRDGYEYQSGRVKPLDRAANSEMWDIASSGGPTIVVTPPEDITIASKSSHALIAPITVRGQVIGMFNLGDTEENRAWDDEDMNFIKTIADQVGLALENVRLLEQTQRRAEREHLVTEITGKLRASNDPQIILQTAVNELRQALHARHAQIIIQPVLPESDPEQPNPDDGNGSAPDSDLQHERISREND